MDGGDPGALRPSTGRPSRREVLAGALALGAAGSALPAFAADAGPTSGGTLRLGLAGGSTTDTLDPRTWDDSVMIAVGFALYNNLVEIGADNRAEPALATGWEPSDGARVWTLALRRGVHFRSGREFTADDAVYSLNLHRGDATSGAAGVMKPVTDIRRVDASTLRVTLASGNADFPLVLTDYHLKMVPDGFADWPRPDGTGAFALDAFEPGVRVALRKAGPYWKPDRGHLDAVEITVIDDVGARMAALISGEVDAINRADTRTVSRIDKSPTLEIVRSAGGWYPVMAMMVDRAPYDSPDLRRALKCAVDREQMIKVLFSGYGTLGNDNPIPRSDPAFNTDLEQLKYDPDKARFHFRRAGVANPNIVLRTSAGVFGGSADMATLLQATASRCDIPVAVRTEPSDGYFTKVWLKEPFTVSYWAGRPSATQMLEVAYGRASPWNESHWTDPRFDQLLTLAQAETDETRRRGYVWDMQALLTGEGGTLIPCFRDWLDAHNRRVGGHTPHSGFDMDNGRICEMAWIKAER
ncbi:ABC transporter substrate-binding protein [Lichenibacterium dinghuense]|uniref:ABC transporter substrate-binding protein n=1 Tax=Lichenibacterium dinghuense TaxID=2895977 RepID=UPI001F32CD32|nr:ABC transporter substrate-binding protein [Lichenibacterium sp. 6Y81]